MIIWLVFVLHHLLNVGVHVLDGSDIQGEEKVVQGFSISKVADVKKANLHTKLVSS